MKQSRRHYIQFHKHMKHVNNTLCYCNWIDVAANNYTICFQVPYLMTTLRASNWPLIDEIQWVGFIIVAMSWFVMCLNILPKNIFTVFVEIDALLMQNNLMTVIFWDTILRSKKIKFLSAFNHHVLRQSSWKMYIGQVMITCMYSFCDDSVVSFCLGNVFLRVWVVHMYRRRLYCRNWIQSEIHYAIFCTPKFSC